VIQAATRTFPALLDAVAAAFGPRTFLQRRNGRGGDPVTYGELFREVRELAEGLLARGIERGDRVGLIAENRCEWLVADLATIYIGAVDVPRGSDTSPDELALILAHSGSRFAFADNDKTAAEILALRDRLPDLETVCVLQDTTEVEGTITLATLRAEGARLLARQPDALRGRSAEVSPEDLMTIVYTSGTTSEPKGVMLTHNNVISNLRAVRDVLHIADDDVFLSVLPAWHMYERILDYAAMCSGAVLVYTERRRIKDDLQSVRPTAFAGVPRIWEMLHDGIVNQAHKMTGLRGRLLGHALSVARRVGAHKASLADRAAHAFYARTILPKIRAATGGRLKLAISGGGSLPAHVDELLLGIGIPLLNGYGLTETSPVASLRIAERNRPYVIGPPLPNTRFEIRDEKRRPLPQGQVGVIWIQGPQVMKGYYRNEERTRAVLDDKGFFNSGDLGCVEADGQVRITGRAKDTIVLATGENVEPEPLETALKASPHLDQAIVLGQDQKHLGALLVPSYDMLAKAVPDWSWGREGDVLAGRDVAALYRKLLDATLTRERGFRPLERIGAFAVLAEPMTVENGLLTPTMKVKRHVVRERYARVIERLFAG
jgi:long-chain acyl-CoA synthetase